MASSPTCGEDLGRGRGRQPLRWDRDRRLARTREEPRCTRSSTGPPASLERLAPERPRHLLGIGEIDHLIAGVQRGIDTFDCAMPTRLGRHGVALTPNGRPAGASIWSSRGGARSTSRSWTAVRARPAAPATAAPTCTTCCALFELTGARLVTLHNLSFIARLMGDLRGAIDAGRLTEVGRIAARRRRPGRDFVYWLIRLVSWLIADCVSCAINLLVMHGRARGAVGDHERPRSRSAPGPRSARAAS